MFLKYLKLVKEKFEEEKLIDVEIDETFNSSELSQIFSNPEKFRYNR